MKIPKTNKQLQTHFIRFNPKTFTFVKTITIGILALFYSCQSRPSFEDDFRMTDLPTPKTYKLLNLNEDWAIGESERTYNVQLNRMEYAKLVTAISTKSNFIKADTRPEPILSTIDLSDGLKHDQAYQHKSAFGYEVFIPNPGLVIFVDLKANGLLHLSYSDL